MLLYFDFSLVSSQPYNVYKYAINTPYNSTLWCWHDTSLYW